MLWSNLPVAFAATIDSTTSAGTNSEPHPASTALVKNATLRVSLGGSHGLADTLEDQLNADLIAFLRSWGANALRFFAPAM